MAMDINSLMIGSGPAAYHSAQWHRLIETHLDYLRNHPQTSLIAIEPQDAYKYEGDLFGLLLKYKQPMELHFPIMRMNRFTNQADVTEDLDRLLIPDAQVIHALMNVFLTRNRRTL